MTDAFSRCHPILNFFYFAVVLGFTMFIQHPVFLAVSFIAATAYSMWLNGVGKILKINFLLTIPSLLIVALLNPMFNHYGVTMLYYIESSGNWVTLDSHRYEFDSWHGSKEITYSPCPHGYTYRLKASYYVYSGSQYEYISATSANFVYN